MSSNTDNPIPNASEDLLRRGGVAQSIADNLRVVDVSQGYVFGVLGPWGAGKTSLINLVRQKLAEDPAIPVLDFNPWMFSGAEQLMESFFSEVAAQLRLKGDRFDAIASSLDAYSELIAPLSVLPFVGAWFDRLRGASGALKRYREARQTSVQTRRAALEAKLLELPGPIVVVIDDIDRLATSEIREMFKLVRLTASFPNILYVLAFDRHRVERALSENDLPGRAYLEKIMQAVIDIPRLPEQLLLTTFGEALNEVIVSSGVPERLDEARWPDVLSEVIWPLINNMRDVRRYTNSLYATLRELEHDVEWVDVLALEAVRVFLPDTFVAIHDYRTALTATYDFSPGYGNRDFGKPEIEALVAIADKEAGRAFGVTLVERLFPAAQRLVGRSSYGSEWQKHWQKAHRVAHADFLRRYLDRFAGEGLEAFATAERLFAVITDESQFRAAVGGVPPEQLEDTIAALEAYENDYPVAAVEPATVVLLNVLPAVPERERGVWQVIDGQMVVRRVVLRLLRVVPTEQLEDYVNRMLPRIETLTSRLILIDLIGHQENSGHKLVSETTSAGLEKAFGDMVVRADIGALGREQDLLRVLYSAQKFGADVPVLLSQKGTAEFCRQLIKSARTETKSQVLGSRAVQRRASVHWELLIKLFGEEAALESAVQDTRSLPDNDADYVELLALVDRYISGWRPPQFGADDDE